MSTAIKHALLLLASLALAASAHASYGQMRLDGVGLLLILMLTVAYGVLVDLALFARLFRHRMAVGVAAVLGLLLVALFLSQALSSSERAGYFKGAPGGAALVVLVTTSAMFLPFVLVAPFAQQRALRRGRRWPTWVAAWMAAQLALLPAFLVLAISERYFWQREYAEGMAAARELGAGELSELPERIAQRHGRIWGTGWSLPWPPQPQPGYYGRSAWIVGLARGLDASALVATNEPLSDADRSALRALIEQPFAPVAIPNIKAKLIWDTLEPGSFARELAPHGFGESGVVSDEVVPVLVERLEQYGALRLCPGGVLLDADRAVLDALIQEKGRVWNTETRTYDKHPDWVAHQVRLDRTCPGQASSANRVTAAARAGPLTSSSSRSLPTGSGTAYPPRGETPR